MTTIAVLGTLDTKGQEHAFLANLIRQRGLQTLLIDAGGFGQPQCAADVTREAVAAAAGLDLAKLQAANDRGAMVEAMATGAARKLAELAAAEMEAVGETKSQRKVLMV